MFNNRSKQRSGNRRRRKSKRGKAEFTFPWKAVLAGVAVLTAASAGGYLVYQDMNTAKPDDNGCYKNINNQAYTVALIDVSDPGFDEVQSRDAHTAFSNLYHYDLKFNEQVSIVSTSKSNIGSVAKPIVTICAPAKSPMELESVGAASATQAYLDRQLQKTFEKQLKPHLDNVFDTNPSDANSQKSESPILEQIQSVSRMHGFKNSNSKRRLIVVSDVLQNTQEAQFCQTKGHLPSFAKFKSKDYFQRNKPRSLNGVDVQIYMLIRGELGKAPYSFCSEFELRGFWELYFKDAGASSVDIIRLRRGRD